jgi:hypothetical protein
MAQPCGCASSAEQCCSLDCLEQPRFFCGQLLTDQDLTALLRWTQDKLRLGRYRHGWGVVCGLEVRCDPKPGWVIVSPGYAVSCCGDDIIVCQDEPFDLGGACTEEKDPCAELYRHSAAEEGTTDEAGGALFYGVAVQGKISAIDLYIRYREAYADPQTALGRSVCREVAECEYSRTREVFTLSWQPAITDDPVRAAAERWHGDYEACLQVVTDFQRVFPSLGALSEDARQKVGEDIKRWLLRRLGEAPLRQFCFVHDWICTMTAEELTDEAKLGQVLFWLVQDCHNAFLTCACYACQDSPGVPLARVWLQATPDSDGKQVCTVLGIDAYPPYRRPLSPECWPAPLGSVNAGQVIWHDLEEARTKLADLGVDVVRQEVFNFPGTVAELEDALRSTQNLFLRYDASYIVLHHEVQGRQRVVGFRPSASLLAPGTPRALLPARRKRTR